MTHKQTQFMGSYIKQKRQYLTKVLAAHRESGYSASRLSKIFPVPKATIRRWIIKFASDKTVCEMKNSTPSPKRVVGELAPETPLPIIANETANEEVERLKRALREAPLRADFYNELINVAEAKFDILIRKKAGDKR